jgi:CcmD family protein
MSIEGVAPHVVSAYLVFWAAVCAYVIYLGRRLTNLSGKLDRLEAAHLARMTLQEVDDGGKK